MKKTNKKVAENASVNPKELALKYGLQDFAKRKKLKMSVEHLTETSKPLKTVSFDIFNDDTMKNPVIYKTPIETYESIKE